MKIIDNIAKHLFTKEKLALIALFGAIALSSEAIGNLITQKLDERSKKSNSDTPEINVQEIESNVFYDSLPTKNEFYGSISGPIIAGTAIGAPSYFFLKNFCEIDISNILKEMGNSLKK